MRDAIVALTGSGEASNERAHAAVARIRAVGRPALLAHWPEREAGEAKRDACGTDERPV